MQLSTTTRRDHWNKIHAETHNRLPGISKQDSTLSYFNQIIADVVHHYKVADPLGASVVAA